MSSKLSTFCMVVLLLLFSLTCRSRPAPPFSNQNDPLKVQQNDVNEADKVMGEESCEGVGEEECLMRRTLAAHTDYIYTQKQNP